jgi:hypothetical protein
MYPRGRVFGIDTSEQGATRMPVITILEKPKAIPVPFKESVHIEVCVHGDFRDSRFRVRYAASS